ncbi:MAG TPA: hypothetical protein VH877_29245 [Polyangia bacterium]|nr:hypothetical protein [Polyangia bacterium]
MLQEEGAAPPAAEPAEAEASGEAASTAAAAEAVAVQAKQGGGAAGNITRVVLYPAARKVTLVLDGGAARVLDVLYNGYQGPLGASYPATRLEGCKSAPGQADPGGRIVTWVEPPGLEFADTYFFEVKEGDPLAAPVLSGGIKEEPLDLGEAALAFGKTVGKGLLVIGIVGAAVGAEIITAGQATWLLVGLAGYAGLESYLARREEIEAQGHEVAIPATLVHSAGDIVGVSQMIEGITGHRLGTEAALDTETRSEQLGSGAGNVAAIFMGSRVFYKGLSLGRAGRAQALSLARGEGQGEIASGQGQAPDTMAANRAETLPPEITGEAGPVAAAGGARTAPVENVPGKDEVAQQAPEAEPVITQIESVAQRAGSMNRGQVTQALENLGLRRSGSPDGRFMHFRDAAGRLRARIDPPDKITPYEHLHIYNENGELMDPNGNAVPRDSPAGHIKVGP